MIIKTMGKFFNATISFTLGTIFGLQMSHHYLNKHRVTIENKDISFGEKSGIMI